jgi:hypothetical protein
VQKKKKQIDGNNALHRDHSNGVVRITPLRKSVEKNRPKIIDDQTKPSKKQLQRTGLWSEQGNSHHRNEDRSSDKMGHLVGSHLRHAYAKESEQTEYSKYRGPISSPLVLNKEQKQKLSKLLEKANSSARQSKNQDEYLLRVKLSQLKSAKAKGQSKQKVFYCDKLQGKQVNGGGRVLLGTQSSKNFYSHKTNTKPPQEQTKNVGGPTKKLLAAQKNQSKSQTQFFVNGKGDLKKNKKKTTSEAKAIHQAKDTIPVRSKDSRVHSSPDNLPFKQNKGTKINDKVSCSNSKTGSKVPTVGKDGYSFRQSEEVRDQVSNDMPTVSSRDYHGTNIHTTILKKIQLKRDLEHIAAATLIQKNFRGYLGRKRALQMRVLKNPYRYHKAGVKTSEFDVDLMKVFEKQNASELFKKPLMNLRSARINARLPTSNKESVGPTIGTPKNVFAKVKLSKSWIDSGEKLPEHEVEPQPQGFDIISGEEFCGRTISSRNFSKNTSFKGEGNTQQDEPDQFYVKENYEKIDKQNFSQEKQGLPDPSQWPQFAKEEYHKWKKVTNILHNLERQLGGSADEAVQSMLKEIEFFAESSKRTFKEVFLINDSFASNAMSDARSSKIDPLMKGNQCFERKMAIKGPKFANFIEKNSSEVSQNEDSKKQDFQDGLNETPQLSKKGTSSKWHNKEILEKWVEPSDKQSVSSALGGVQLSKSNIILISQLHLENSPSRDGMKPSPTSASSSPRPHLLSNLFSIEKEKPSTPKDIKIIENLRQTDSPVEDAEMKTKDDIDDRLVQEPIEKRINTVESYEDNSGQDLSESRDSFGNFQTTKTNEFQHKSRKISSSKSKEGLNFRDLDSKSNPESTPETEPREASDKSLVTDHISSVLLELLIEEALLDANDIMLNYLSAFDIPGQALQSPSLGVVSLGATQEDYPIFSLQGINEYLMKFIGFCLDNSGMELTAKYNKPIHFDRFTIIKLMRELELELFSNGGQGDLETFDAIIKSFQGSFLEEALYSKFEHQLCSSPRQISPRSFENHGMGTSMREGPETLAFRRLLFDCMNEMLTSQWLKTEGIDFVRLVSMGKQPNTKQPINLPNLEQMLLYTRDQILDFSLFGCGMLTEKLEQTTELGRMIDPVLLRQVREDRLVKMLSQEVGFFHQDHREREEMG